MGIVMTQPPSGRGRVDQPAERRRRDLWRREEVRGEPVTGMASLTYVYRDARPLQLRAVAGLALHYHSRAWIRR
jgi:hypothetical protein